jgi:membrane-associated phospholipid phosphatase
MNRPSFLHQLRIASEDKPRGGSVRAGLAPPIPPVGSSAGLIVVLGALIRPVRIAIGWITHPARRTWAVPIVLGLIGFLIVHPWDGPISEAAAKISARLAGDVRRELHAWQQFGAAGSIVFVSIVVVIGARARARRLLDLYLSLAIAGVLCTLMKMGLLFGLGGRPRPREMFNDPHTFLGPLGVYPVVLKDGSVRLAHAWESAAIGGGNDLWSMPSSHTVYAVVLAVFLSAVYPRLRSLWIALAVLVAICRVLFDAHWPTDVIVGAALGGAVASTVHARFLGVRLIDWLWRVLIDPRATPALPALKAVSHAKPA